MNASMLASGVFYIDQPSHSVTVDHMFSMHHRPRCPAI